MMEEARHVEVLSHWKETNQQKKPDQFYYGHGKILLSGEYFVLDGAKALAIPVRMGQSLAVKYSSSFDPKLKWVSLDHAACPWFEATFEFWRFNLIEGVESPESIFLQKILRQARRQNPHFLRDDMDVEVITYLDFPRDWGLGSSSTLIYNIAQWAYVSPFELARKTQAGSGYDIACAQSESPIVYQLRNDGPYWAPINFNPSFKDQLLFLYLGNKQLTHLAVDEYRKSKRIPGVSEEISKITEAMLEAQNIAQFEALVERHEDLVAKQLGVAPLKQSRFADFNGAIKSLGDWGGDFALVVSRGTEKEVRDYFASKGLETIFKWHELVDKKDNFYASVGTVH